jgi:ADP-ribose pyrophosphatase
MEKWKTISSEYIYKTPYGNLRKDICELPNGNVMNGYYVNEYSDWVNAVVITEDQQIVLVEQYRYPTHDFFLEIPAGKVEENETYENAILRELREETGFTSNQKPLLLGEFWVNPATQDNKVITYLILDAYKAYEQELDTNEILDVKLFHFNEVEEMIRDKRINQLFTVSAYYMSKVFLK